MYRQDMEPLPVTARVAPFVFKGRRFDTPDLALIQEIVKTYQTLSRQELAGTVCGLLEWTRPGGKLKTMECRELLTRLEADGWIELPALAKTEKSMAGVCRP